MKFNNQRFFNATKEKISAKDPVAERVIKITPASGGWLTSPSFQVYYTFGNAKLSDATIAPEEATYTYSGKAAAVSYNVTIGTTALRPGTDYELEGYYKYPESGAAYEAITAAKANKSLIEEKLSGFGSKVTPKDVGRYVLVIKAVNGSHYEGYNIAEFSIVHADFTAALKDSAKPVKYGDDSRKKPDNDELVVTGLRGEELTAKSADSTEDGFTVFLDETQKFEPRTNARIYVEGTGGYSGCKIPVDYSIFADISPATGSDYDFSKANLSLESHTSESNCLGLTLKNDGDYPLIGSTDEIFNPSTLTLEDKKGVKIPSTYLTTTVTGIDSEDNLTTVGKKMITVSGASGKPVTGSRYYYVEVFADLSTAGLELRVNGKAYPTQRLW